MSNPITLHLEPPQRGDLYSVREDWHYEYDRRTFTLELTGNPKYLQAVSRFLRWSMELNGDLSI